jgi:CubicO group peptidase (beta-lactamase class C family)
MTLIRVLIVVIMMLLAAGPATAAFPGSTWDHADAQQQGWSTELLDQAKAWSQRIRSSAVMIIQHGAVVAEWGDTAKPMELASVRKSLLSALIGVACERGQINPSATIGSLGIDDDAPSLSAEEKSATVGNLLRARSGVYHAALYETPAMAARRPPRGSHAPGTFWYYNNWDFNTLGAIYLDATGSSVFDALDREIAKPIGMQDYKPSDGKYFTGPDSVYPAYPIRMSARDLARFALLYLNNGRWQDRQIVSAQWVHDSTQSYSATGFGPGYGYLWWTGFLDDDLAPTVRLPPGTYFAAGDAGQFAFIIPADDLIVVHRVDRDIPGYRPASLRDVGRLLWLILSADHQTNIGPDASLEAARGTRLDDAALRKTFTDATFAFGSNEVRFAGDGSFAVFGGSPLTEIARGQWTVEHGRYCRTIPAEGHRCYAVVAEGKTLDLFDDNGLIQYSLHLQQQQ